MKTRAECIADLKRRNPNASAADLDKMADEEMKAYALSPAVIRGVEIFAPGTHNGDPYTEADIDDMVAAYGELDFRPAIKIGHTKDAVGAPAYGWVTNLSKKDGKLVADFESMDDSVVDALRQRKYGAVSSEIYFNLKRAGKTFRRALKAVALLGAEVPAVAEIKPLWKMEFAAAGEFEKFAATEHKITIPMATLLESYAERVADLIQTFKEDPDMKLKDLKIKELTDQVAALQAKVKEFASKSDKDKDEEVKKLTADIEKFEKQIKELAALSEDDVTARELAESKQREEALNKQVKELSEQTAALAEDSRRRQVNEHLSKLLVPAFKPAFEAMLTYAILHAAEKVKVYSKDKDGKETSADQSLLQITTGLMTDINAQAKKLFAALGTTENSQREEGADPDTDPNADAGAQVDKKVKELRAKDPKMAYSVAMEAVLAADPPLAKAYAEQSKARAAAH